MSISALAIAQNINTQINVRHHTFACGGIHYLILKFAGIRYIFDILNATLKQVFIKK